MVQARGRREWGGLLMATMLNLWAISSDAVHEELSRQKGEPEWMLQKRLQAWEVYENTPAPLGRRGDLGTLRTISNSNFRNSTHIFPRIQMVHYPPRLSSLYNKTLSTNAQA